MFFCYSLLLILLLLFRHQLQVAIDKTNGTQSLKQFLFSKSQKGEALSEDEEEYVDLLNRQVVFDFLKNLEIYL